MQVADVQLSYSQSDALTAVLEYQLQLMERTTRMEMTLSFLQQCIPDILKKITHLNDTMSNFMKMPGNGKARNGLCEQSTAASDPNQHLVERIPNNGLCKQSTAAIPPSIVGEWTYDRNSFRLDIEGGRLLYKESFDYNLQFQGELVQTGNSFEGDVFLKGSQSRQGRIRLIYENNQIISNFRAADANSWSEDTIAEKKEVLMPSEVDIDMAWQQIWRQIQTNSVAMPELPLFTLQYDDEVKWCWGDDSLPNPWSSVAAFKETIIGLAKVKQSDAQRPIVIWVRRTGRTLRFDNVIQARNALRSPSRVAPTVESSTDVTRGSGASTPINVTRGSGTTIF